MNRNANQPTQIGLFDVLGASAAPKGQKRSPYNQIPDVLRNAGVVYEPGFMTTAECDSLLGSIDGRPWMNDLKRRVQHYGWRYDYSSRFVTENMKAESLPYGIKDVAERLRSRGWFSETPDQVIVNEYEPGQGIAPHVDRDCFGPAVATLSLGDCWPMQFIPAGRNADRAERREVLLDVGSILVLTGAARNKWMHGIARRRADGRGSDKRERQRRVSVTFRTVKLQS